MQVINPTQMYTRTLMHPLEMFVATVCLKTAKNVRLLHDNRFAFQNCHARFRRKVPHNIHCSEITHHFDKMELRNLWFPRVAMVVILAKQDSGCGVFTAGTLQRVHGQWSLSVAFLQLQQVHRLAIFCVGPYI